MQTIKFFVRPPKKHSGLFKESLENGGLDRRVALPPLPDFLSCTHVEPKISKNYKKNWKELASMYPSPPSTPPGQGISPPGTPGAPPPPPKRPRRYDIDLDAVRRRISFG